MDRDPATRRSAPVAPARTAYRFDAFELRPGQLLRDGRPVPLGSSALEVLRQLLRARGDLVTKDELFAAVWPDVVVVENTLHQHVRALRRALGDREALVETVARRGYRFTGPVEEVALAPADARRGRARRPVLAMPLTPLVGRLEALAAIEELLAASRCVTLLGPGGVGKTRLAFEVARRREESAPDAGAMHVVELAAIVEGEHVAAAVAEAVCPPDPSGAPPVTTLRQALRDADAWIVLDNCEHLIEATAALAAALLQACPALRILATSQRPLGIAGEQRFHVPPLRLPPPGESDPARIAAATAVQLLVARVGESDPSLAFDAPTLATAAELCRQLDANPLAFELAAVRVATLGLAAVQAG